MLESPLRRLLAAALFASLVALPTLARASGTTIVPVSPRPDEAIATGTQTIVVDVVSSDAANVDPKTVRFILDGRDVTDRVSVSGVELSYDAHDLANGAHKAEIDVDRGALGRSTYEWSFRVDPTAAAAATSAPDDTPINGALPSIITPDNSDNAGYAPDTVSPYGPSPYYWGDTIPFLFNGGPGGFGYLTFGGIPGIFDLFPFGGNQFFALVPVPYGYNFSNPPVIVHYFNPRHKPVIIHLRRPLQIIHKSDPAPELRHLALERLMRFSPQAKARLSQPVLIDGSAHVVAPHPHHVHVSPSPTRVAPMHVAPVHVTPVHVNPLHVAPVHVARMHTEPVHVEPVRFASLHVTPVMVTPVNARH